VASNLDANKIPLQNFTFPYKASWGDLYIVVTSGNAPNLVYTLNLEFVDLQMKGFQKPHVITQHEVVFVPKDPTVDFVFLDQIINTGQQFSVLTSKNLVFNFSFCPTAGPVDKLVVQATATDEASAMALYVCIQPSEFPCTPATAQRQNSDARGVSIVTVPLNTASAQYTKIQALVTGWGQFNNLNNFLFSVNSQASTS